MIGHKSSNSRRRLTSRPRTGAEDTLGALFYRAGRYQEALEHLEQAWEAAGDQGNARCGYWLAMTCQKLGRSDEARAWLEKSDVWVRQERLINYQLHRLRQEARQVVLSGTDDQADREGKAGEAVAESKPSEQVDK